MELPTLPDALQRVAEQILENPGLAAQASIVDLAELRRRRAGLRQRALRGLAMEIAGRAGGLVPTNRIALRDLVFYGGEPLSVLEDQLLERREGVAQRLYELAPVSKEDVFVLASNSGINGVVVELALLVKERGARPDRGHLAGS